MANDIFKEAQAKAEQMFVYFSDLLNMGVIDTDGRYLGVFSDASVVLGDIYPKLDKIVVRKGFLKRHYAVISASEIDQIDQDIVVKKGAADPVYENETPAFDFLLRRDVLDQQVVDTYNHKVRRVNDIHLLKVDRDLMVVHVDIGLRGLVRRMGWEKAVDLLVRSIYRKAKYLKADDLVSWKYVQPVSVNPASMTMKLSVSQKNMQSIPAADLGDMIFDLNVTQRMALFRALDVRTKAKVFENLDFEEQKYILKELDKKEAAQIVEHMSTDEATDLLEKLPKNIINNLLTLIESNAAKKLSTLLGYSSDSAGGIMNTEFVSVQEGMSAADVIEYVKSHTKEFDIVHFIFVVDPKNHLKGVTTLRRLLMADQAEDALKTAFPKTFHVYLKNSVREVAFMMDRYKLWAVPVIDENKIMHGIITVDDILDRVISIAWRKSVHKPKGV